MRSVCFEQVLNGVGTAERKVDEEVTVLQSCFLEPLAFALRIVEQFVALVADQAVQDARGCLRVLTLDLVEAVVIVFADDAFLFADQVAGPEFVIEKLINA